jgi:Kef-type K+ transport system membrane component KefB
MAMGAMVANFSREVGMIMDLCDEITPPIFLLFFVASGADLKLSVLPTVGLVGATYIILRVIGKVSGASLGAAMGKAPAAVRKWLGYALVPQAGVAIGLSLAASRVVPEYASEIRAVILCATLVYELVGPAVTKMALTKAGEIKENA